MASEVDICNRALQKLGAKRIASLSEDSVSGRACNSSYELLRDYLTEMHPWKFAIERASLAADASAPDWGRANSFQLPSDFLRILPPYVEDNLNDRDWMIEGGKIFTDESAPLYIRYIKRITDTTAMPPSFRESLAAMIAMELCEQLTQSNTKKADLEAVFKETIESAKAVNAIQQVPIVAVEDSWITGRS